jgi:hypothetical protein
MAGKKKVTKKSKGTELVKATPEVVEAVPISDEEAAVLSVTTDLGIKEFDDPSKMNAIELEEEALRLVRSRYQNEAQLSAVLFYIDLKHVAIDHGWDPKEYFDKRLGISLPRAHALINTWKMLATVGVDVVKRLIGLSWEKLKTLKPAVEAGKINKRNIEGWLKKCAQDGLTVTLLEKEIRALIAKDAREELDESLKTISFKVAAFSVINVQTFEEIASKVLKTEERGQMYLKAMLDFSANYADAIDAKRWKALGLATLKEMAEQMAPVAALFFPTNPDFGAKELGVAPVLNVYQGFGAGADGPGRELRYCIASSVSEAKAFLGVENVREFKLELAPSFMPKAPFLPIEEKEEEEEEKEPSMEEMKKQIKVIVAELKMTRETYAEMRAEIVKEKGEMDGDGMNKAIYEALIARKEKA